jgi:hypothetical protein
MDKNYTISLPYHLAFAAEKLNFADNYFCAKNRFRQKKSLTFVSEFFSFFQNFTWCILTLQPPKWKHYLYSKITFLQKSGRRVK